MHIIYKAKKSLPTNIEKLFMKREEEFCKNDEKKQSAV